MAIGSVLKLNTMTETLVQSLMRSVTHRPQQILVPILEMLVIPVLQLLLTSMAFRFLPGVQTPAQVD